jgi:PAS domain S-box-containing protein
MFPRRLSAKFLLLVLGILVLFFGMLSLIIIDRETDLLTQKASEKEHLLAQTIVADLRDNMLAGRPRSTLELMDVLQGSYGLVRLEVLRKNGSPAFDRQGPRRVLQQINQAFESGRSVDFNEEREIPLHTNIFPLHNENACRRCHAQAGDILGVILISHTLEGMIKEIRTSKQQLIALFSIMIIVLGSALFIALRKVVLAPLRSLYHGAKIIGMGNFAYRISTDSRDEISELAGSFNEMAETLQDTYSGLENMVMTRTEELHESTRLMQGILTSMSSGVVLLDREGRVKLINRPGAALLGRTVEELLGRKLAEVVPETQGFFVGRIGGYEEVTVHALETRIPLGFTVSPYSGGGPEQEGIIVVFQDLSELKALQGELLNKERFAAMGRVVAGVAHEIRNPLFGISAIGQIFERELMDPAHQELCRALLAESKRLNQLVEELLIYGRPMKLNRENADLRGLWEAVLELYQEELKQRGIKVTGDCAVRYPIAYFDTHQVRQVFLNVLRNAMEAMPNGGSIVFTMRLADKFLSLQVTDTGAGIQKESLEHIFDLFFTTKPKGTGLGLAICRKIMRDHDGDITIDSVVGQGTTVAISLPYRDTARDAKG